MMRLKPFWSYYGAKYNIAHHYPCPQHSIIIEPFAGSAQYSLLHYKRDVRLYDLDENICMVWDYLIHAKESQLRRLTLDFKHIDDLKGYSQEERVLMGFWLGEGIARPQKKITKFARKNKTLSRFKSRALNQVDFIRHWKIEKSSYADISNISATWFIDPPYQKGGQCYRKSSKAIDYQHLAQWCKDRMGVYIVCEAGGAQWLPFKPLCVQRSCRRGVYDNKELIYSNAVDAQLSLF